MDLDNLIFIDDSDPRVYYSGNTGWDTGGSTYEFGTTAHGITGNSGRALLTFIGTSVTVYATIPKNTQGNSTYNIDGATSSTFTTPLVSQPIYQQVFYQSPRLENKQHTLIVMPSMTPPGMFWLDYFTVTQPPAGTMSTMSAAASTSTELAYKTNSTSAFPHTSTDVKPIQTSPASDMQRVSLKAIVAGSVVGGILVLLIIAFFIWRGYKRRNGLRPTPASLLFPTEPSRVHHSGMYDAHRFHKSPGLAITSSLRPSETPLTPETREFVTIPTSSLASNVDHVEPCFGASVEAPPTYSTHISPPV